MFLTFHFASNQNGSVYTIVPSKLLICQKFSERTPPDLQWADIDGRRHFSAEWQASLLSDLRVSLALVLDDADDKSRAAFRRHGINVSSLKNLHLDGSIADSAPVKGETHRSAFQARDLAAFASLAGQADGAVAILCADAPAERARASILAAAFISKQHSLFPSPEAAAAWAALSAGGAPAPAADDLALLAAALGRRWTLSPTHSRSAPSVLASSREAAAERGGSPRRSAPPHSPHVRIRHSSQPDEAGLPESARRAAWRTAAATSAVGAGGPGGGFSRSMPILRPGAEALAGSGPCEPSPCLAQPASSGDARRRAGPPPALQAAGTAGIPPSLGAAPGAAAGRPLSACDTAWPAAAAPARARNVPSLLLLLPAIVLAILMAGLLGHPGARGV